MFYKNDTGWHRQIVTPAEYNRVPVGGWFPNCAVPSQRVVAVLDLP
jgi:hypothetical protein